jgi:hypothetical protein
MQLLNNRSDILLNHFGCSLPVLIIGAIISAVIVYLFTSSRNLRVLFTLFLSGAFLHLFWWVFLSNGMPRYALIGIFLDFTAISSLIFNERRYYFAMIPIILSMMVYTSIGNTKLIQRFRFVTKNNFHYHPRVKKLLKTTTYLQHLKNENSIDFFISGWWPTTADIEYLMPTVGNFKHFSALTSPDYQKKLVLVRNTRWVKFNKEGGYHECEQDFTRFY